MYTLVNGRTLFTISYSTSPVFFMQFSRKDRGLLNTFDFNKLAYCDVIIPGRGTEIHLPMPIDTTNTQTKS